MLPLFKKIIGNLFHLGAVQATNILLQLILIPLVVSRVGIEANGYVLTALSLSGFLGIIINFASNQTGPIKIKLSLSKTQNDQSGIADLLFIRLIFFLLFVLILFLFYFFKIPFFIYLIGILPLLFSEVLNPYMIYLGKERLQYFNLGNLFSRILAFVLIYFGVNHVYEATLVNAFVGFTQSLVFIFLWIHVLRKMKIEMGSLSLNGIKKTFLKNMPLTISNMIVHLQQSVFLFGLGFMGNPLILGAYAIADKLVWGARMILIAFSNAIYPAAIDIYNRSHDEWIKFRKQVNIILSVFLVLMGVIIFILAPLFASWLTNGANSPVVVNFIRFISPVPLVIGLNALNVMELLMKSSFTVQLRLSFWVFLLSVFLSLLFLFVFPFSMTVLFLFFMESFCLIIYEKSRSYYS